MFDCVLFDTRFSSVRVCCELLVTGFGSRKIELSDYIVGELEEFLLVE